MAHISKSQVKLVRSLQQKKVRDELGLFVAEGDKCIGELKGSFALELLADSTNATDLEISQMSSLRTPQGSIAVFHKPQEQPICSPLTLVLDGIQDPGNLGTIIRTCDWFGVNDIVCSLDTADCYNPKVIQATMGALSRVRVHYTDLVPFLETYHQAHPNLPIYGTLLEGKNMYLPDAIPSREEGIVIMGNEGNGISQSIRPLITHPLLIPSYTSHSTPTTSTGGTGASHIESLNVSIATAIILAELRR